MKLSIIIPVYNEQATFATLLASVRALPIDKELIVVDNVSTDGTREQVAALAGEPGVLPVLQPVNRGKGSSVRVGLALARGEWVVVQDADLEYEPRDLLDLLALAESGGHDAVFGSRLLGARPDVPWHHALGRDLLNGLFRLLYGACLTDVATCYKLLRTSVAQRLCLDSLGFDLDYELPCRLRRAGVTIVEAPVSYHPRTIAAGKKLRWTDGLVALRALLRYRWRRPRLGAWTVGQTARVLDGPFTDCEGTVSALDPAQGAVVLACAAHGRDLALPCAPGDLQLRSTK